MSNHIWKPVDADDDGLRFQITYRNECGEEYVHVTDACGSNLHSTCWKNCYGDWPGCKKDCQIFASIMEEQAAARKQLEQIPELDPFSFLLNWECFFDDHNCYVEAFDTLNGAHWEIAVDVDHRLLELLDEDTEDDC